MNMNNKTPAVEVTTAAAAAVAKPDLRCGADIDGAHDCAEKVLQQADDKTKGARIVNTGHVSAANNGGCHVKSARKCYANHQGTAEVEDASDDGVLSCSAMMHVVCCFVVGIECLELKKKIVKMFFWLDSCSSTHATKKQSFMIGLILGTTQC